MAEIDAQPRVPENLSGAVFQRVNPVPYLSLFLQFIPGVATFWKVLGRRLLLFFC